MPCSTRESAAGIRRLDRYTGLNFSNRCSVFNYTNSTGQSFMKKLSLTCLLVLFRSYHVIPFFAFRFHVIIVTWLNGLRRDEFMIMNEIVLYSLKLLM